MRALPLLVILMLAAMAQPSAGQSGADSLGVLYEHASDDSSRIALALDLVNILDRSDPVKAIELCEAGLKLVEETRSVSDARRLEWKMALLHAVATSYSYVGDNERSVRALLAELKLAQESGNTKKVGGILMNVGVAYQNQGMGEEARQYYSRTLALAQQEKNVYGIAMAYGNIGTVYGSEMPDSTIYYYRKSLQAMEQPGMRDREGAMGWMMNNIGSWHEGQGNTDSAFYYFFKSLAIRESIDHRLGQFIIHRDLANLFSETGNRQKALEHINASIRIGEENGFVTALDGSYALRSRLRAEKGDYHGALEDHQQYVALRDSVENEKDARSLIQQSMRYEYGRKHLADSLTYEANKAIQEKEIQRQRTMRNGFMGGFALVALFAGVFFTQRNRIAKEKARSEELLLNILPEEIAEELKAKGASDARQIDEVTVLFSDFKGFTTLAESMSAHDLVRDLNTFFSAFDRMCQKHGIEKIKTIGDAYMAAGGLPTPNQTHATDVVSLALDIQAFMHEQVEQRKKENRPVFEIRIGIHTGPVVAGIVGVKKFAYDIWGDTVNTAARMEQHGEPGRINVSGTTYERVKDAFTCVHRGRIDAKNKGEIDMYFVEGR